MARNPFFVKQVILLSLVVFLVNPVPTASADSKEGSPSYFRIEGKDKSRPSSSFDYNLPEPSNTPTLTTDDSPELPEVEPFREPSLVKGTPKVPHGSLKRPKTTVVQDFSTLELLGIGLGVAVFIGIL